MTEKEIELYSDKEFRDVVSLYQQLLNMVIREVPGAQEDFNIKETYNIIDIKRWLKDWSKQIFWDYLSATHWSMENLFASQFDKESTFRCIKLIFPSWKSITFINNPKFKIDKVTGDSEIIWLPDGVLCFDYYRKKLNGIKTDEFDKLYGKLNNFEKNHFIWKSYTNAIWRILKSRKDSISDNSKDNLSLALNLQYE